MSDYDFVSSVCWNSVTVDPTVGRLCFDSLCKHRLHKNAGNGIACNARISLCIVRILNNVIDTNRGPDYEPQSINFGLQFTSWSTTRPHHRRPLRPSLST